MNKILNVAIIGCGRIAKKHTEVILKNDNMNLVAGVDICENALNEFQSNYDVNVYKSIKDLFDNEHVDMVSVCTPSGVHGENVIELSDYCKNIICEKPMDVCLNVGKKMTEICKQKDVNLFIVKQNRFNDTIKILKNAIEEKRFGKIFNVNINVFWTRPQEYYDQDSWRGTWKYDGGAFMNQASHYVDLMTWLFGDVSMVHSFCLTQQRNIEAEDSGVVNIKFKNGGLASMNVSMLTYPKNLEGSITIIGENGTAKVGGVAVNEIQVWDFADKKDYDDNINDANYNTTSVYGLGHFAYYDMVYNNIIGESNNIIDGREGLKSLELLNAIYKSSKEGKVVELPL